MPLLLRWLLRHSYDAIAALVRRKLGFYHQLCRYQLKNVFHSQCFLKKHFILLATCPTSQFPGWLRRCAGCGLETPPLKFNYSRQNNIWKSSAVPSWELPWRMIARRFYTLKSCAVLCCGGGEREGGWGWFDLEPAVPSLLAAANRGSLFFSQIVTNVL